MTAKNSPSSWTMAPSERLQRETALVLRGALHGGRELDDVDQTRFGSQAEQGVQDAVDEGDQQARQTRTDRGEHGL